MTMAEVKHPGALTDATGALVDVHASANTCETITLDRDRKLGSSRERDDDYRAEIVRLSGTARVIVCKNAISGSCSGRALGGSAGPNGAARGTSVPGKR